jgi:SAM-dependent methyltransferase
MHDTAYKNGEKFFDKYCKDGIENKTILDVGSYDVCGTLKPIFKEGKYTGLDIEAGPNVDVVITPHEFPFERDSFDIIVSSSCFEHNPMFWLTFSEMCRVAKSGGYIYICAPSAGAYHGHPGDCWRFYADSWKALETWAKRNGHDVELVESYVETDSYQSWKDSVGIYRKR